MASRRPRPGFVGRLLMAVLGASLGLGAPRAESGGIPLGSFEFYPSISIETGDDSNIFNQVDSFRVEDEYVQVRAPLVWRLPFHQSAWDVSFIPGWNRYQENDPLDGSTQEFSTRLFLAFSNRSELEVLGSRLDDYLNTTAFDPGGEVSFGDSDFTLDNASVRYDHPLSPRQGFRIRTEYSALHFDESVGASFVNFRDIRGTISYLNALSEATTLFVDLVGARQDQERTEIEIDEDRSARRAVQFGLQRRFDRNDRAHFFVGYEQLRVANTDDAEFSGLVARATYSRLLAGRLQVNGELVREATASVFNVNNFYVSNRLLVDLDWRPGASVFYRLSVDVTGNGYPEEAEQFCRSAIDPEVGVPFDPSAPYDPLTTPCLKDENDNPFLLYAPEIIGVVRRDWQLGTRAGVGFQFSRTAAIELSYFWMSRDSNMDPFDFTTGRLSIMLRFGWSPDRELI
jgi:hypothetical protein